MALQKGVNAYSTVDEANVYFADSLDVSAWAVAEATEKAKALVTAARVLDTFNWVGTSVTEEQPLAFPRSAEYFDPKIGTFVYISANVPSRIINASFELAYHLLNNDGMLDNSGSVLNISVGPIKLDKLSSVPLIPPLVKKLIKPLLLNNGANPVWRAN